VRDCRSEVVFMRSLITRRRKLIIAGIDLGATAFAVLAAFLLRFDFAIPQSEMSHLGIAIAIAITVKSIMFQLAGMHRAWWRFASFADLGRLFAANAFASIIFLMAAAMIMGASFPRSIYVLDFLLCFLLTSSCRFTLRVYREILIPSLPKAGCKGVLIYGAGAAGIILVREVRANPTLKYEVLGFLDDDP